VTLSDKWAEELKTLHGFQSNGFPNCFFMGLTQGTLTPNFTHMLGEQADHIAYIVGHVMTTESKTVEATSEAERDWVETIHNSAIDNTRFQMECTPGYYNNEGRVQLGRGFTGGQYGRGPVEFFKLLADWRAEGNLRGLEIH
jgi:cyclohexanone monooxygenase